MRLVVAAIFLIIAQSVMGQVIPQIHSPNYAEVTSGEIPIQLSSDLAFDVYLSAGTASGGELLHHSDVGVSNAFVASINSLELASGQYTIRVIDSENNEASTSFIIDNLAKQEWLKGSARGYQPKNGEIKAVDFENDGLFETVFIDVGEESVNLVVLNSNGNVVFEQSIAQTVSFDAWQLPIVTELDESNPNKELVLVRRDIVNGQSIAFVEMYSSEGTMLASSTLSVSHDYFKTSEYYRDSLQISVGDVDGDGGNEIIIVDQDTLYILDAELEELATYNTEGNHPAQIVVAPLDTNLGDDIVIRSRRCENFTLGASGNYYCSANDNSYFIQAFNLDGEVWQREFYAAEMFAVDIDRDFNVDLLLVEGNHIHRWSGNGEPYENDHWPVWNNTHMPHHNVMVAPIQNGSEEVLLAAMWTYEQSGYVSTLNMMRYITHEGLDLIYGDSNDRIRLGDFDGLASRRISVVNLDDDAEWEYLVKTRRAGYFSYGTEVHAIDDNGDKLDNFSFREDLEFRMPEECYTCSYIFYQDPVIADIDNDGFIDVSVSGHDALGVHWESNSVEIDNTEMAWGTALYDEKNQNYFKVTYADKDVNQVYFRGTPNGFGTTRMRLIDNHVWEIKVNFSGNPTDRFKFDIHGDWHENYGDLNKDGIADLGGNDIFVNNGGGDYVIQFNDETFEYTILSTGENRAEIFDLGSDLVVYKNQPFYPGATLVQDPSFMPYEGTNLYIPTEAGYFTFQNPLNNNDEQLVIVKDYKNTRFDQVFYRGTTNNWSKSEMVMVDHGVWEIEIEVDDGREDHNFKFDISGDWSYNFGDNNSDGSLEQWGANIALGNAVTTIIRFHEESLTYEILSSRPPFVYFEPGMNGYSKESNLVFSTSLFNNPFFREAFSDYGPDWSREVEQLSGDTVEFSRNNQYYPNYPWLDFEAPGDGAYTLRSSLFVDGQFSASADITYIIVDNPEHPSSVQFACHNVSVNEGYGVYVVGNNLKLGNWKPTRFTRLKDFGKGIWGKTIEGFAEQSDIEWKCVIAKDETLGNIQWESGGNNQITAPAEGGVITSRGYF